MTLATKEAAMDALEATRAEWLAATRAVARQFGRDGRLVTVNDIRPLAPRLPPEHDGRVWGAVFTKSEWECLGYVRSTRRRSHCRPVAQFKLKGA